MIREREQQKQGTRKRKNEVVKTPEARLEDDLEFFAKYSKLQAGMLDTDGNEIKKPRTTQGRRRKNGMSRRDRIKAVSIDPQPQVNNQTMIKL